MGTPIGFLGRWGFLLLVWVRNKGTPGRSCTGAHIGAPLLWYRGCVCKIDRFGCLVGAHLCVRPMATGNLVHSLCLHIVASLCLQAKVRRVGTRQPLDQSSTILFTIMHTGVQGFTPGRFKGGTGRVRLRTEGRGQPEGLPQPRSPKPALCRIWAE